MSITSRINEMSSHIEQAYDELQGLGADLTNVNKNIENISMVLDDIYDSMPQVSGEGTSLTLEDTRVGKIKSTLKGNTSQSGTPTPTSPIPVNVVSGDNEINVVGKNLLNINNWVKGRINNTTGNIEYASNVSSMAIGENDITFVVSQAWNSGIASDFIPISTGDYVFKYSHNREITMCIDTYDNQKLRISRVVSHTQSSTPTTYTFTISDSSVSYIRIHFEVNTANVEYNVSDMQLEKGSSATSYEPYQGANYQVNLGSLELCKIGNYQDYFYKDSDKWYLHKEIAKYIFTGNETGELQNSGKRFDITCSANNMPICINNSASSEISQIYCNILLASSSASAWGGNQGISYNTGTNGQILVSISGVTTTQAYLSALKDNYCYYILATPTITEITYQPLIDQLNLLEKAMSKDGQTNISQVNNDLPFIISASALKEWQENTSLNSTLSMVNPLSLGNTLNTQEIENNTQPIEVDNIEPLEEEENEES